MTKKLQFKKIGAILSFFNKNPNKKTLLSKELIEEAKLTNENITEIRGQIINHVISIESLIDDIIASYFTNNLQSSIKLKRMVLSTHLTTFQKWKILKEIIDNYKYFDEIKDKKQFKSDIKEIINIRNEFAHGELQIDLTSKQPYLEFYREGFKKKAINQKNLDELHQKMNKISKTLSSIQLKIMKEY